MAKLRRGQIQNKMVKEEMKRMIPVVCIKIPRNCFELLINLFYRNLSIPKWLLIHIWKQGKLVLKPIFTYLKINEIVLARTSIMEADTEGTLPPNSKILCSSVEQSIIS